MAKATGGLKELRGMPDTELRSHTETLRRALWDHRTKQVAGAQPKTHEIRAVRRQMARALTVLNERQRQGTAGGTA